MNRVAQKGLVTAMVAGGLLAGAGYAQADSAAQGDTVGSPGVLSGNSVQVPVDVPVNVCGNTVNVVGLLNSASGNTCANTSAPAPGHPATGGARPARHAGTPADERAGSTSSTSSKSSGQGAHAAGGTRNSPGVLSGNSVQLPIHVPVNITGNSVNVVGVGNTATGNTSTNGDTPRTNPPAPTPTAPVHEPVPAPPNNPVTAPYSAAPTLAHTGADGVEYTAAGSAAMLLGGVLLYRRFRPGRG